MGVSLQMYRVRIGTFHPSVRVKTTMEQPRTDKNKNLFKWSYKLMTCFALLCLLTTFFLLRQDHLKLWTNLVQAAPTTACDPSRGPICTPGLSWTLSTAIPWIWSSTTGPLSPIPWASSPIMIFRISHQIQNKLVRVVNGNRGHRGHGIRLAHWNKGPSFLQNSHSDIETVISDHKPHLIGLSEANLKSTHDLSLVQHREYQLHTCATLSNPALGISRVVTYTHRSLIVKRRTDLDDDSLSAIWLEVGLPRHKKIIVCQAYREWGYLGQGRGDTSNSVQAQLERWSVFLDKWELALQEGKEVIVMMDANIDFLKWTKTDLPASDHTVRLRPLIQQLFTRIFPLGVSQLVTTPTRFWTGQVESGLDHLYTNKPDKLSSVDLEFTGMSDHKIIKVTRFSKSLKRNVRYVRKRSFKNFDREQFSRAVQELSWWDIYMCEDVEQAADLLTNKLTYILDKLAPVKTFQVRNKYAPWLSDSTKQLIKERNQAQKLATETKDLDNWNHFKNLRNTARNKMKKEKKLWEEAKLNNVHHNPSTLWQNVKGWLNWTNTGPPCQLFHLGRIINSPAQLAQAMNTFFINKVVLLRNQIPDSITDPLGKLKETMETRMCSMKFRSVKPKEVYDIIKNLKNSKSTGIDFIDTATIKLVAKDILPAITHIVNLSLSQSTFPQIWKHSKVIPLLKKDDPLNPKNYRPVALLPILSKILEKSVFLQLVEYLDNFKLLSPNHHGSRHSHNTATALIQMYDQWTEEVEEGKLVGIMMIDLSAAFDMVDHKLLLQKLALFGLEEEVLKWIKSYLADRKQSVSIDGCLSPPLDVEHGVPQGSILGPLLYILFTNDIPDIAHTHPVSIQEPQSYCSHCGSTVCYVDDCTFSHGNRDPQQLSHELTLQYKKISEYMAANKLVINGEKTQLVVVAPKQAGALRAQVVLQAGNYPVTPAPTAKLLGGIVSEDAKWRKHILGDEKSLIGQLTSRINGLSMITPRATFATRLMVANGIVISKLCYLIQLWGGCEDYLIKALQVVQTRAARTVCKQNWFTPTHVLLTRCRWLSVRQLVFYQTAIMTFKIMKTGAPAYLGDRMRTAFPYNTRQATTGAIRFGEEYSSKHALNHNSFKYRATVEYNSIPGTIRAANSLQTFKTKLRTWIKANISVK